ncbi:hypothetical protein BHS09_21330 [Myxococcus xanthus]|uniref:Uncharacterized protein n=1 Tax=Myxococcus xanthus TaxID=34 RepID=A0AAE6G272_MYXXA|nr:hypothetical protein BHS09_21330 [Myxococcus xanthus]
MKTYGVREVKDDISRRVLTRFREEGRPEEGRALIQVQLSLIERTINALNRAHRMRSGTFWERMEEEAAVLRSAFEEAKGTCTADLRAAITARDHARDEVARLREALTDVLLEAEVQDDIIARIATSALSIGSQ